MAPKKRKSRVKPMQMERCLCCQGPLPVKRRSDMLYCSSAWRSTASFMRNPESDSGSDSMD
jgi:hypothetical protein